MQRISIRTVELTDQEQRIKEFFEVCLDNGLGIADAVKHCQYHCGRKDIVLSDDFWNWLGE